MKEDDLLQQITECVENQKQVIQISTLRISYSLQTTLMIFFNNIKLWLPQHIEHHTVWLLLHTIKNFDSLCDVLS